MKLAIYTECVSPHQLPMAKEIAKLLGDDNFRNIYDHPLKQVRIDMGWDASVIEKWELVARENKTEANDIVKAVDVLVSSARDFSLFARRSDRGLMTIYYGERWFKPWLGARSLILPGVRLKNRTVVAAGSVVTRSNQNELLAGNQAVAKKMYCDSDC